MKIRLLKLLSIIILLFLPSCGKATYSKAEVKKSIIELCKKEYDLDNVQVKIIGATLGVYIPIKGLVDSNFRLDETAGKKIENVALSIHRVNMSMDKPLKFYTLTARDTENIGAEFILTGFVYDIVRVRLLDISRGEYHKRILRDFKFNPVVSGLEKIKDLINELNQKPKMVQGFNNIFYPIYSIGEKGSQKIELNSVIAKEISAQEALFYIYTKEYYEPLPKFEAYRAIFPPGFTNEYLMLVNVSALPNPIKEIVPKYFYSGTEIRQRNLGQSFSKYQDIGYIGIDGFPKKDLDMGWFLNEQLSRRIKILFDETKKLKEGFSIKNSTGFFDGKTLRLRFSVLPDKPSSEDNEIIFSSIAKMAYRVLHRYNFEDFEGIELISAQPEELRIYLTKDNLEKIGRNKIKIEEFL